MTTFRQFRESLDFPQNRTNYPSTNLIDFVMEEFTEDMKKFEGDNKWMNKVWKRWASDKGARVIVEFLNLRNVTPLSVETNLHLLKFKGDPIFRATTPVYIRVGVAKVDGAIINAISGTNQRVPNNVKMEVVNMTSQKTDNYIQVIDQITLEKY